MIINNKPIKVRRFCSKEMRLLYDDLIPLAKDNKVHIVYNGEESLFELAIIIKFFQDNKVDVCLTLAYLPYQRMDHNNGYEANTLKYVAEIINSWGLKQLYICEPHCDLHLFKNAKAISLVDSIYNIVAKKISFDKDKDYLVFADKSAKAKYGHLGKNHIYFEKCRDVHSGLITTYKKIGTIRPNRKVLIIDDIISSGDTLINCLNLLNQQQKVNIIAGHFEKNKYNKRILDQKNVEKVYSSNSLTKRGNKKLCLYKIENLLNIREVE